LVDTVEVDTLCNLPKQMVVSFPALAVGSGLTVIVTVSLLIHPVDVLATVTK
jgi:hypothetical protein